MKCIICHTNIYLKYKHIILLYTSLDVNIVLPIRLDNKILKKAFVYICFLLIFVIFNTCYLLILTSLDGNIIIEVIYEKLYKLYKYAYQTKVSQSKRHSYH